MKLKKISILLVLFSCLTLLAVPERGLEQCTSAVVSMHAAAENVPILWKNRDTGELSNKVVYVKESPYRYLALVNADSSSGRQCFAGLNSKGFAIMNTVAYNLPKKTGEMEDLEGIIMADALRTCQSVHDFEGYIKANQGPWLGSWSNFGVIDAAGNAFLFEIHNHGYKKIDAAVVPGKYIVNTNYARSGTAGKGAGYLRFERASQLFQDLSGKKINFQDILCRFTRDISHILLKHPSISELKTLPTSRDRWIYTRDCINRPITSAAAVFIGKDPSNPNSLSTMWIIPGEPLCAIALPLWVEAGCCPEVLWKGESAPMWQESLRIKKIIRPYREGSKINYLNLTRLDNADGTGYLPIILNTEEAIINETIEFLKENRTPSELAAFQEKMAEKAYSVLKSIR